MTLTEDNFLEFFFEVLTVSRGILKDMQMECLLLFFFIAHIHQLKIAQKAFREGES